MSRVACFAFTRRCILPRMLLTLRRYSTKAVSSSLSFALVSESVAAGMRSVSLPLSIACRMSLKVLVLAEQKCYFRVDHVTREHRVRVLRDALGQHDELARGYSPASTRTGLQRQRSNLFGEIEQGGVVVVDRAHRLAQGDKVALLVDHEIRIAFGF